METQQPTYRILTCYYRPKPGGFCKRLFRAIEALLERGHTVHYLAVVPYPITHPNCYFHRFPWPQSKTEGILFWGFFHFLAPVILCYLGFRFRTDKLFAFGANYALILQPLRILKRIPLTLFLRADALENHKLKDRSALLIQVERFLEGISLHRTRFFGVSKTLTNNVIARHTFLKPYLSGTLINDTEINDQLENAKNVSLPLNLGCVGILESRKNQEFLLKIMANLTSQQAQLYLYGTGPDEQRLNKIVVNENLSDRVHFMGWVHNDELWNDIDILLAPSLHEGAPNAVLEAIGRGLPVIASDIPEHGEILPSENLLSLLQSESWVQFFLQDITVLNEQLEQKKKNQKILFTKLCFDWDNEFVKLVSEK